VLVHGAATRIRYPGHRSEGGPEERKCEGDFSTLDHAPEDADPVSTRASEWRGERDASPASSRRCRRAPTALACAFFDPGDCFRLFLSTGPRLANQLTCSFPRRDQRTYSYGWCSVVLSTMTQGKGGHIEVRRCYSTSLFCCTSVSHSTISLLRMWGAGPSPAS
jgi:hypothetical protein